VAREFEANVNGRGVTVLSESIILAVVPAYAYTLAFAYEYGFTARFGVPASLVVGDLATTLWVLGTLVSSLFLVFWLSNLIFMFLSPAVGESPVARSVARIAWLSLYALALGRLAEASGREALAGVLIAVALGWIFEFGLPMLTQRHRRTITERADAQERTESKVEDLVEFLRRRLGSGTYNIIAVAIGALIGAQLAGDARARNQSRYFILPTLPPQVIIRVYHDHMLTAEADLAAKKLTGRIAVRPIGSDSSVLLEPKEIVPLLAPSSPGT
jgi:hypothetical protein